jgi:two-component sensor histidine kinase
MSGVSIDITDRKETDELRALLNQELAHRIKNMLATVQTVVLQSLRDDKPRDEIAKSVGERIAALSRSQDVLTGKNLSKAGLVETVRRAVEPFNGDSRVVFEGPDTSLPQDVSRALIMALHELSTNAIKYGALSNEVGTVAISWTVENVSIDFRWIERGGPPVSPPTRKGFGSRMIEKALAATVRGTAAVDYRPEGVVFTMQARKDELG